MSFFTISAIQRLLARNPGDRVVDPSLTPAGVLLLLYRKSDEYCILLNKRSEWVEDHKGEIALPGGRKDICDRTVRETALRETHEEMGISPEDIQVLGQLDDVPTVSNYLISTWVGTIPYPYDFEPCAREVAEVLEVPISLLRDRSSHREEARLVDGRLTSTTAYSYQGHLIYGATAQLLGQFLSIVDDAMKEETS